MQIGIRRDVELVARRRHGWKTAHIFTQFQARRWSYRPDRLADVEKNGPERARVDCRRDGEPTRHYDGPTPDERYGLPTEDNEAAGNWTGWCRLATRCVVELTAHGRRAVHIVKIQTPPGSEPSTS